MRADISIVNECMTIAVEGEINTITTPELSEMIQDLHGAKHLIFDLKQVRYVSSAGLRLFLGCLRTMKAAGGSMKIINLGEFVMETFTSVGYDRIMDLSTESGKNESNA